MHFFRYCSPLLLALLLGACSGGSNDMPAASGQTAPEEVNESETGTDNETGGEQEAEDSSDGSVSESLTIQAQDFIDAFDTTEENEGGAHRDDLGVGIEETQDTSGDFNVGWTAGGEWLEYDVNLQGGTYRVSSRVASDVGGGAFIIAVGELDVPGTQRVNNTGGWQSWVTIQSSPVDLPAGEHKVRLSITSGEFNLNWIRFETTEDEPEIAEPVDFSELVWSDEFDSIDPETWTFETGGHGWGNQEFQYYTDGDNAQIEFDEEVDSNVLVIEARAENPEGHQCSFSSQGGGTCEYTSSRMISMGKQEFQYGRMEARIKLPSTQGLWPAFWMMGNDFQQVGWPNNGEIDIMEHVGFEPNTSHGALHGPGYSGNTPFSGSFNLGEPADANYRVYAVEWTQDSISWYVDDNNFFNVSRSEVEQFGNWVFDHPFFFLMNIAVGGTWPGSPDETSSFPQRMYVDYIRVYQ